MGNNKKVKGTWGQRFFIILLVAVLGVLLFWLLGFVTKDIGSLPGPLFSEIEAEHVDAELVERQNR